jgi:tetratricopeptide (TPR) repeat protein
MGVPTLLAFSLPLWPNQPLPLHFVVWTGGLIVFNALGVALHELGHAVVARLVGYGVAQIRWGYGPPVFTWRCGETQFQLRTYLFGGLVFPYPRGPASRLSSVAISAAGPLVNAMLMGLGLLLWRDTEQAGLGDFKLARSLAIANGWLLISSLIPVQVNTDLGEVPSDGLALINLLLGQRAAQRAAQLAAQMAETGTTGRGYSWFTRLLAILMALAAGICGTIVLGMGGDTWRQGKLTPGLTIALLILALVGGVAGWMAARLWRKRNQLPPDPQVTSDAESALQTAYTEDFETLRQLPADGTREGLWVQICEHTEAGDATAALQLVEQQLATNPTDLWLIQNQATLLGQLGRWDHAVASYDRMRALPRLSEAGRAIITSLQVGVLAKANRPDDVRRRAEETLALLGEPAAKIYLLECLCALFIFEGHSDYLPDADEWSATALALKPLATLKGTRGSILMELGRLEEAESLLRQCLAESTHPTDQGISKLYLALIAHARGEPKAAKRLAWEAWNAFPHPMIYRRFNQTGLWVDGKIDL